MILVKKDVLDSRKVEGDDFYKLEKDDFYEIKTKDAREEGRVPESLFSIYNTPVEYAGANGYHFYSVEEAKFILNGYSMPPFINELKDKNNYNDSEVQEKLDAHVTGEGDYISARIQLPESSHPETYYDVSVIRKAYEK